VKRFMPGEHAEDALREGRRLQAAGIPTLVTCLGENVTTEAEATGVVDAYCALADAVRAAGLDMELSVKLTHLGLDHGVGLAARNLARIAEVADGVVWVDMEGSDYVDRTLDAWREARAEHHNVGICLQAYLHRTEGDFEEILHDTPHIRLVKGAYMEPPDIAMAKKSTVDEAFRRLASRMLRERLAGRMGRPAIATHDSRLVGDAQRIAFEIGLATDRWEIDMLYGIAEPAQAALVRSGVPLRVLISYGTHWFPWYMRRLAERPANVGFVLRQMVSR
jgi:proline dehydrogenase